CALPISLWSARSIAVRTMLDLLSRAGRPILPSSRLSPSAAVPSAIMLGRPPTQRRRAVTVLEPGPDLCRPAGEPCVSDDLVHPSGDPFGSARLAFERSRRGPERVRPARPEELVGVLWDRQTRGPGTQARRGDPGTG